MISNACEPMIAKDANTHHYAKTHQKKTTTKKTKAKKTYNIPQKSKDGLYVDESTYWEVYYEDDDFHYEWNNGILEEKEMPTFFSELNAKWLGMIIDQFLRVNPIAQLIRFDIGFTLNLTKKKTIRKPDFTLILNSNPVQPDIWDRSYKGTYDLCIEFLSDSQKKYVQRDTVEKKREYKGAKVKEYYIIDADKKHTAFYRLNQKGNYVKIKPEKGVIRSAILPGFQFRIDDIYLLPDLDELINDEVYKSYILVDFQNQCLKTEKERKAKEKERKAKNRALKKLDQMQKTIEKEKKEKIDAIKKLNQIEKETAQLKKLLKEKGITL
ncbi:protein containing DUF820 [Candidatus Magnetomorum sp. HK-1]|nr:protein containing DUF820 [Candidatus Magnetomorum sp. HK-1]